MKIKFFALSFLFPLLFLSCQNVEKNSIKEKSEINTTGSSQEVKNEISMVDRDAVIKNLQGNWKEPEYPFRLAQFKDTLVKFIEEGIVEEPGFREYRISKECPFEVNNIKNIGPDDIILVMKDGGTCEKLKVSSNTLTLSGFNVSTGMEYRIVYNRVE